MTARSARVAVVTGAAGGLGGPLVRRLAADGFTVAALDITEPDDTAGFDDRAGITGVRAWRCDVSDPAATRRTVEEIAEAFGGVDVLVNNAGLLSGRSGLLEATPREMHRFFAVNAVGPLLMVQACVPWLVRSAHRGRVINVASRTFFTGSPGQLAYVASKGALIGVTRVMARELGEHGITVNAVAPAQVATPGTRAHSGDEVFAATMRQQAIQEYVTPEHFAGLVSYLASPDGAMVTGQTLVCDGGGLLR
ncbi:SDR family NAD(P)-dependent oxidoreductase [Streptomyces stelliscabiei]|uniref:3-oxoacyl-[acyl-carrier protein] reductase n=1 Tax=Streptomyces stelliscabiei TaxID=146820 RepID=A0A8I0TN29_9ACTN|nr:SDR family oxidoreductase [Streptomyces stelliscabiei]KND45935.1 alcohol dehydrogenase [Streptomyces stelliscabiei]MBE1595280.1 3-oxoacyl-[acyl-carrier protein] reductase [Streptomyces stelliscabiei]MDX2516236.1 SDR family oxidoreductase [Streptomyces stelliscabiei]MDX2553207.1 SDR family oxidoreductase [Streptomyces stelliscabiei]MDX2612195.1 SDR family oxidoreductase [Streptomyces stelliscabiei]